MLLRCASGVIAGKVEILIGCPSAAAPSTAEQAGQGARSQASLSGSVASDHETWMLLEVRPKEKAEKHSLHRGPPLCQPKSFGSHQLLSPSGSQVEVDVGAWHLMQPCRCLHASTAANSLCREVPAELGPGPGHGLMTWFAPFLAAVL